MCPKYEFYFQQLFAVVLLYVEKSLDAFSASLVFVKNVFSLFINEHVSSIALEGIRTVFSFYVRYFNYNPRK